jgi:hypothetical protein
MMKTLADKPGQQGQWPRRWYEATRKPDGVALVATLIMLSLVTFMTVAFLGVARRERRAVSAALGQGDARDAMGAALEHAQADLIGRLLRLDDPWAYGLIVSTQYVNPAGLNLTADATNANYFDTPNNPANSLINLANLQISPWVPVYDTSFSNGVDSVFPANGLNGIEGAYGRFYLDFNRNGFFEPTFTAGLGYTNEGHGYQWLTNLGGFNTGLVPGENVGDPQWIGILENPNFPHSSSNRFVARYCYLIAPIGKSLDLNHIHNQAKQNTNYTGVNFGNDAYLRHHGAGSWELNLAGFLRELNTNFVFGANWTYGPYRYGASVPTPGPEFAFQHATDFLRYRYNDRFARLASIGSMYGATGFSRLFGIGFDLYSELAPVNTNGFLELNYQNDFNAPWAGGTNLSDIIKFQHPNELLRFGRSYDTGAVYLTAYGGVTNDLNVDLARVTNAVYDRYTFYRLMSQMGTDSEPEHGRLNVNFDNIDTNGLAVTPDSSTLTNGPFRSWTALRFFTNVAQTLLDASIETNVFPRQIGATTVYITNFSLGNADPNNFLATNGDRFSGVGLISRNPDGNGGWLPAPFKLGIPQIDGSVLTIDYTNSKLQMSNIMIYPFNMFTPEVHRLFQLAANIYETAGNAREWEPDVAYLPGSQVRRLSRYYRTFGAAAAGADPRLGAPWVLNEPGIPQVFRPTFRFDSTNDIVYLNGFIAESNTAWLDLPYLDMSLTNDRFRFLRLPADTLYVDGTNMHVRGIPSIIGAKGAARDAGGNIVSSGLPNLNEVTYRPFLEVTRKLELVKTNAADIPRFTNHMFEISMQVDMGAEMWLPYRFSYPRNLQLRMTNEMTVIITNEIGPLLITRRTNTVIDDVPANSWVPLQASGTSNAIPGNFRTPFRDRVTLLDSLAYSPNFPPLPGMTNGGFRPVSTRFPSTAVFTGSNSFPDPQLGMIVSNWFTYAAIDTDYNLVVDHVNLTNLVGRINLIEMLNGRTNRFSSDPLAAVFWRTNRTTVGTGSSNLVATTTNTPAGVAYQIQVGMGRSPIQGLPVSTIWQNYSQDSFTARNAARAADFLLFATQINGPSRRTRMQVPFSPTRKVMQNLTFEVNDPMVHYQTKDLGGYVPETDFRFTPNGVNVGTEEIYLRSHNFAWGDRIRFRSSGGLPLGLFPGLDYYVVGIGQPDPFWLTFSTNYGGAAVDLQTTGTGVHEAMSQVTLGDEIIAIANSIDPDDVMLGTMGNTNEAYRPWAGHPARRSGTTYEEMRDEKFNMAIKDPGIYGPEFWSFPERRFASIGWLGRVHRGTPWQTVYMKAEIADTNNWDDWAKSFMTHPTNDWQLFDALTAHLSEGASRGLMSVNQTNAAAWAALLSGVIPLSDVSPYLTDQIPLRTPQEIVPNSHNLRLIHDGILRTRHERGGFKRMGDLLSVPELSTGSPFLSGGLSRWRVGNPYSQGNVIFHRGGYFQALVGNTGSKANEPPETNNIWARTYFPTVERLYGMSDEMVERIPEQIMGLLKREEFPRVAIYAYGQKLAPAEQSVYLFPGPYQGMVTNYQVIGEMASKTIIRVEGLPDPGQVPFPTDNSYAPSIYPRVVVEDHRLLSTDQ